ncbi:Up-regulated during septation-domain-containing protein [Xylaria sp. FL0933]|nr:Up-regulated during septation-domain-containing protein [Xylaria sp. FL0933]
MAHIAACMIDSDGDTHSLRSYIANTFSAKASTDSLVSIHSADEKKPLAWRMHNHTQEKHKYQLFPKEKQLPPVTAAKPLDLDQAHAIAMGQSPDKSDKSDKPGLSNGLLLRIKEHNLTRRRKVSVPELGPMTTVQEVSMDSPTIPGRPALHERSISTPVNTLRLNLRAEPRDVHETSETRCNNGRSTTPNPAKMPSRQPLSPKDLAPLTIPSQTGHFPALARKLSLSRLRSGSNQQDQPVRPPRPDESPKTRAPFTPFTPISATGSTSTPRSATAYTNSTIPTPISAPPDSRRSPSPWEKPHSAVATAVPQSATDIPSVPKPDPEVRCASAMAHKRGQSDSGSIMERGRPRKRIDGTPIGTKHRRTESKRSLSAERRAFETLPQGYRPKDAITKLDQAETTHLRNQALGQAARFEVLRKEDVDNLSKELRQLDERTEYLRHTYTSLRAGRRNLQSRVCQYLRSPRMAKFSYESMLKQEETLAELDASIDDWVTKLEHAENRRTRVRQKLLEHVAAAAAMSATTGLGLGSSSETLQQAMGMRAQPSAATDVATPPRSPTKGTTFLDCASPSPSSSPQRVVARVPSAIIEEENEDGKSHRSRLSSSTQTALERMESIRIYADSDVYALLEDVENEFTKLNGGTNSPEPLSKLSAHRQKRALHHAHSHDVLGRNASAGVSMASTRPPPLSPAAPSPPTKNSPTRGGDVFLTSAVFQPQQTTVNA